MKYTTIPTFHRGEGVTDEFIRKLSSEGWCPLFSLAQGAPKIRKQGDVRWTLYARDEGELILETYWDVDEYIVWRKTEGEFCNE